MYYSIVNNKYKLFIFISFSIQFLAVFIFVSFLEFKKWLMGFEFHQMCLLHLLKWAYEFSPVYICYCYEFHWLFFK